jgi:hypothetical protein
MTTNARTVVLNERGKQLAKLEREGKPLYIREASRYHLVGSGPEYRYTDVRKALCGANSGVLGQGGVTDTTSGLPLCKDCEALWL